MTSGNAQIDADVASLNDTLTKYAAVLQENADTQAENAASFATALADLKAANPTVDTSALDSLATSANLAAAAAQAQADAAKADADSNAAALPAANQVAVAAPATIAGGQQGVTTGEPLFERTALDAFDLTVWPLASVTKVDGTPLYTYAGPSPLTSVPPGWASYTGPTVAAGTVPTVASSAPTPVSSSTDATVVATSDTPPVTDPGAVVNAPAPVAGSDQPAAPVEDDPTASQPVDPSTVVIADPATDGTSTSGDVTVVPPVVQPGDTSASTAADIPPAAE